MGQCIQKEVVYANGVENNKGKRNKKQRKNKSSKGGERKVLNPNRPVSGTQRFAENFSAGHLSTAPAPSVRSTLSNEGEQPEVVPETFSMGYSRSLSGRFLERKNSSLGNKLLRISASEGNVHDSSDLQSPFGSDQNDSVAAMEELPISSVSPGKHKSHMSRMFNSPKLAPRVLFKQPLPKHLSSTLRREKNNSTSSLYITDTIQSPNVDEVIKCLAGALLYHIREGMNTGEEKIDTVFSEKYHPLTRELLDLVSLPDLTTIYRYVKMIFQVQKLPAECAILCLAYIERILSTNRIILHPENWRRIVFGSILIATKVWEDESVWNVDFLDIFPLLTLIDLNNLENRFMELLQFNVLIVGSEYAKYYFELRALSQHESFPIQLLNKEKQSKLEERAHKTNEQMSKHATPFKGVAPKRARSVDFFNPKSPPAVLA